MRGLEVHEGVPFLDTQEPLPMIEEMGVHLDRLATLALALRTSTGESRVADVVTIETRITELRNRLNELDVSVRSRGIR